MKPTGPPASAPTVAPTPTPMVSCFDALPAASAGPAARQVESVTRMSLRFMVLPPISIATAWRLRSPLQSAIGRARGRENGAAATNSGEIWRRERCAPRAAEVGGARLPSAVDLGERDEGAAVAVAEHAHQAGEALRAGRDAGTREGVREPDRVDADAPVALLVDAVDPLDVPQHSLHGAALEFVAEDVNADLLVRRPEGLDRIGDAVGGVAVAERRPGAHDLLDLLPKLRRVGQPGGTVLLEHEATVVVHDLQALDRRVDVEHLVELLHDEVPLRLHAAGGVDHEDDVLAVDRDAADRVVRRSPVVRLQPSHLLGEPLQCGSQLALVDVQLRRVLLQQRVLPLHAIELPLQLLERHLRVGGELACRDQLPVQLGRVAADLVELFLQHGDQLLQVRLGLFDDHRLGDLAQYEQQDDRPEAATDAVEEREAERLDVAAPSRLHGQSSLTLMKEPPVR